MKARTHGFSLVEVTLALAIFSFALVAVIGMIPVGLQDTRTTMRESRASLILTTFFADWQYGELDPIGELALFPGISITDKQPQSLWLDEYAQPVPKESAAFKLEIRARVGDPYAVHARVGWPAAKPADYVEGVIFSKRELQP